MGRRRWIAAAVGLAVLSADLIDSATTPTVYFHARPIWILACGAAAAVTLLVLAPRVPSLALSLGAGSATGGAVGTLAAALVWSQGVPDPLVRGSVAFNVADVGIAVGSALVISSALLVGRRRRHALRQPI